jgi:phycoerythrin-associated linker protein
MVGTFINPGMNTGNNLGMADFDEMLPICLRQPASDTDLEIVIRVVYRQVLGNAYVMESERLRVPESQLKRGGISVREFVRQVAKSDLYRSQFFETCYRYRAIELNFKHLLGRAPDTFEEMQAHSIILDNGGYEAEINSYLDSDEYQSAFGEDIVPYYRGFKTQPGQSLLGFTNMLQLLHSTSGSDKNLITNNRALLTRSLICKTPYAKYKVFDPDQILADLFKSSFQAPPTGPDSVPSLTVPIPSQLNNQVDDQALQKLALQKQLDDLRTTATIGAAIIGSGSYGSAAPVESLTSRPTTPGDPIAELQSQVSEARALSTIAEYRLNKWQRRIFSR